MQDPGFFWSHQSAKFAGLADDPTSFYARRTALVGEIVARHAQGRRIIDIGCGTGRLCFDLAARGFDVHGVDLSEAQIATALRNAQHYSQCDAPQFSVCEADNIAFEGRFDGITAIGVLPYVADHPAFVARAMDRLAPGGLFVASITNNASLFTLIELARHLRRFRPERGWLTVSGNLLRTGVWSGGFVDSQALQCRSARALERLCRRLGLVPIDAVDLYNLNWAGCDRQPLQRGPLRRALARLFGWTHIGIYRLPAHRHADKT
jgi:SAM-dependent methyltransferase